MAMYSQDPVATDLPPVALAFLNTIAGPESGGKYNIRYTPQGGAEFDDLSQHPGIFERTADGQKSSAAGRYQFTKTTWDGLGGGDFSPENQDRRAWQLAQKDYASRTGSDLLSTLQDTGFTPDIAKTLAPTWQGLKANAGKLVSAFNDHLNRLTTDGATPAGPMAQAVRSPTTPMQQAMAGDPETTGSTAPAETSVWDKLKSGGPGALFGSPAQGGWSLQDALQGVSVAALARDKPEAAAALAQYYKNSKAPTTDPQYDTKTGQVIVQTTQGPRAFRIPGWQDKADPQNKTVLKDGTVVDPNNNTAVRPDGLPTPAPKLSDAMAKKIDADRDTQNQATNTLRQGLDLQDSITKGEFTPSASGYAAYKVRQALGQSGPDDVHWGAYNSYIEGVKNTYLKQQGPGVKTDNDARNAEKEIAASFTDPRAAAAAIGRVNSSVLDPYNQRHEALKNQYTRFGDQIDPDKTIFGSLDNTHKSLMDRYNDLNPRVQEFVKGANPGGGKNVAPDAPVPRVGAQPSKMPEPDNNGVIVMPNGVKIRKIN